MNRRILSTVSAIALLISLIGFAQADDYTIACWNLQWFFDADTSDNHSDLAVEMSAHTDDQYQWRVQNIAAAIAQLKPAVLGLEEIENQSVVRDLARELQNQHHLGYKVAFVQGNDSFTEQDVAFLVKDGIDFTASRFSFQGITDPHFKDVSKHLHLHLNLAGEEVHVIVVHLITRDDQRPRQVATLRHWLQDMIPSANVAVIGDFNFHVPFDHTSPQTDVGQMLGIDTPSPTDDLIDLHSLLPAGSRVTHADGGQLDRILISSRLNDASGLTVSNVAVRPELAIRGAIDHGDHSSVPEAERDLSDHFPLAATFSTVSPVPPALAPERNAPVPAQPREDLARRLEAVEKELAAIRQLLAAPTVR